jgi:Rps23 Pro-64 3,4-dihydroxylase Tpa1-like proline 4-hydroxylase|tara:strand:+ start:66 stop:608 length:543 start_codon:yes stop_codon:yes gene_type:complete
MRLVYSIPGKLWWIHNFLDQKYYKNIHSSVIKERNLLKKDTAKNHWSNILTVNLNAPDITSIENYLPFEKLKTLVSNNPYFKMEDMDSITYFNTMIYFWKKGSGINWHSDAGHKYGATYYLNSKWNSNWGGEFMFKDNNGFGFLPCVGNSLIIVKTPLEHKVNPVTSPIIPRISIQMFMK